MLIYIELNVPSSVKLINVLHLIYFSHTKQWDAKLTGALCRTISLGGQ